MTPKPNQAIEWPLASAELTTTGGAPERYIRINITKNTKGYSYETTVSLRWTVGIHLHEQALRNLLFQSDQLARAEIADRETRDALQAREESK